MRALAIDRDIPTESDVCDSLERLKTYFEPQVIAVSAAVKPGQWISSTMGANLLFLAGDLYQEAKRLWPTAHFMQSLRKRPT